MYGVVLSNLSTILIYIGFKFAIKRFKKDKLSSIDFQKYKVYYRDILNDCSPAELSYIDDFEILPQNDIAASLLSLELNNNICLEDKIQIKNNNTGKISSNEKYVFDCIENGKIRNFDENEFVKKVKEDAIKNGLLENSKIVFSKFTKKLVLSVIFIIAMIVICTIILNDFIKNPANVNDLKIFVFVFAILLVLYLPISLITYYYTYILKLKNNNYIRTKKGEEINEKLEGLKNYLKDYSVMHERDEESLTLWEDYLIYSVIFDQNKKIIKNIYDKYFEL